MAQAARGPLRKPRRFEDTEEPRLAKRTAAGLRNLPPGLEWTLIALLVFGGLYIRLYRVDLVPWGLNNDEAINALEIKDIMDGRPFATLTQRGLNRETMFHYLGAFAFGSGEIEMNLLKAMPAVFGLTQKFVDDPLMAMIFPLRSVAIAAGTLTLLALYLFARDWFGWLVALLATAFLAVSPWHLLYSRVGERAGMAHYVPSRYAVIQSEAFISDGMSAVYGLIGLAPETTVVAALSALGIVYAAWRALRRQDAACGLLVLCFLALVVTVGVAGPSLTRMLMNVPWLCLFAALIARRLFEDVAALRPPLTVWLGALLVAPLVAWSAAQGYTNYFLRAGKSEEAMQHFGAPQTIMGMFVRTLPSDRVVYVLHTLPVDTLGYLVGNRPNVSLVSDPSTLDLDGIIKMPTSATLVIEYARPFAETLRYLIMRYPVGDATQIADARLDPDKIIFYTYTLWKDEAGQPMPPPDAFPGAPPRGAPPT